MELYTPINRKIGDILISVENGSIGLPDLQRPFVWKDNKVRDLLDSMLKGFPIGFVLLWESPHEYENKIHIGTNDKAFRAPKDLVIDGQQRLTALIAALKGVKIKDVNYRERNIKISFNPLRREFEVWTQAYERSAEWISAISEVFAAKDNCSLSRYRKQYIRQVNDSRAKEGRAALTDEEEIMVEDNINELLNLSNYTLPTLEIKASANEEEVADIFVRVNSGGQKLTEKNFIETLLAVYDNDLHRKINDFCHDAHIPKSGTSYNHIIEVAPVHIIRATVGIAFSRARLRYAYMLLRGKDLQTGKSSSETQEANLEKFKKASDIVMDLNNWHAFLNLVAGAGYMRSSIISSDNTVIFSYMLYLIGRERFKIKSSILGELMKRWIFMITITGYFTDSPESTVERLFADMRQCDADGFIRLLTKEIETTFTDDYFVHTLPAALETSSTSSPLWYGYIASLNVLNYPMLFSTTPTSKYFVVGTSGTKSSIDIHHIFPKHYLAQVGITNDRDRNQIANYAYLDYTTNIEISDDPPALYVDAIRQRLGQDEYLKACEYNALPIGFENMEYFHFLRERRKLMAAIIKKAFERLSR